MTRKKPTPPATRDAATRYSNPTPKQLSERARFARRATAWRGSCRRTKPEDVLRLITTLRTWLDEARAEVEKFQTLRMRVMVTTKHGPNQSGLSGPCDAGCVKCLAETLKGDA